jgi:NADH dehydrogenase [ubiquinone] 1 alpha subcomplex assembly factor 7
MFIVHEFFDALPVHVFQRDEGGFREVRVDRNPS